MGVYFTLYNRFTSSITLSAYFGLEYCPIILGGGHLILQFCAPSSNIFGDRIQLATLLSSFVLFGINCDHGMWGIQHLYAYVFIFGILLKIRPLPRTVRIGYSWPRQVYYSKGPLYQYQQRHIPWFLILFCNYLLGILLNLNPYQYHRRHWLVTTG